jgi:hypothetical protein
MSAVVEGFVFLLITVLITSTTLTDGERVTATREKSNARILPGLRAAGYNSARRRMMTELLDRMMRYNKGDVRRINHALKVFSFAHFIAEKEGLEPELVLTIDAAAILHDIGIHEAERKHGSTAGNWQELEGPPITRDLIQGTGLSGTMIDRVCFLVGSHHSYGKIDGTDFRILVEADFIVNIDEDKMERDEIAAIRKNIFRTASAIDLLDTLYGA